MIEIKHNSIYTKKCVISIVLFNVFHITSLYKFQLMKNHNLSLITLFTTISIGLFSCQKSIPPAIPERIDYLIYLYNLTYDTSYSISNTGQWQAGTGLVIDSMINVSEGGSDSLIVNEKKYQYSQDMDMYIDDMDMYIDDNQTTVKFSGVNKENINITYTSGVGHKLYRSFMGKKR